MLLNLNSFDIPLIVASDGAVTPQVGCRNLCKILNYLGKNRMKVAAGRLLKKPAPAWRPRSDQTRSYFHCEIELQKVYHIFPGYFSPGTLCCLCSWSYG